MEELVIPPDALKSEDAQEFVRFWIASGREHVSLHVGAMGEHEVHQWGMILADITAHIIRALRIKGSLYSESELRAQLEESFRERLDDKVAEHTGALVARVAKN